MKKLLLSAAFIALGFSAAQGQAVTTWAGTGNAGSSSSSTSRLSFNLNHPYGIVKDSKGRIWVSAGDDFGHLILFHPNGKGYQIAGDNTEGGYADGKTGVEALMAHPRGLATDGDTVFFADNGNYMVRKVYPFIDFTKKPLVKHLAGGGDITQGNFPFPGDDDGTGYDGLFQNVNSIAIHPKTKNVIVADQGNHAIRQITRTGTVSNIAGKYGFANPEADGDGTTKAVLVTPNALWIHPTSGDIYFYQDNFKIKKWEYSTKKVTTLAELTPANFEYLLGNGQIGLLRDASKDIFYLSSGCRIFQFDLTTSTVKWKILAGGAGDAKTFTEDCGDKDGPGSVAKLNSTLR